MFIFAADLHFRHLTFTTCPDAKFDSIMAFQKLVQESERLEKLTNAPVPIVLGGDIWDSVKVHPEILKKVQGVLAGKSVQIYYINGNHDAVIPSWTEFLPNTHHVSKEVVTLPDGTRLVGLDYVHPKKVQECLEDYPNDVDFLLTHQFIEADVNRMIASSVPAEAYYRFRTVLAGDIHQPGIVNNNVSLVFYPGCLSRCTIREPESVYMLISQENIPELGEFTQFNNGYWYARKKFCIRYLIKIVDNGDPDFYNVDRLRNLVKGIDPTPYLVLFSDRFDDEDVKRVQTALAGKAHLLFRRKLTEETSELALPEQHYEKGNSSARDYALQVLRELDIDRQVKELAESAIDDTDKFFEDLTETFNIKNN